MKTLKLASQKTSFFNRLFIYLFSCFLLFTTGTTLRGQVTFYVSPSGNDAWSGNYEKERGEEGPLETISEAMLRIRTHFNENQESAYSIVLREGVYPIESVIEITPSDQYELIIAAYPGEKPVISAGKKIEGWKRSRINGVKCWKAHIPEVKNGDWYFRQLFVNGTRASRPRVPETGFFEVEDPLLGEYASMNDQLREAARDRFIFEEGDVKEWKYLNDVNAMVVHYWQEDYLPVKRVDMENRQIVFEGKSYMAFVRSHPAHSCNFAWYYMDNVFEALDNPGEWYLERETGDLYYIPLLGEEMKGVEVYAPVHSRIISIAGDYETMEFAGNVHFEGIEFRHNVIQPDRHYGTGNNYGGSGDAMINIQTASNCSFVDCEFTNLGEYGIEIGNGSREIFIYGNRFYDMGSGAIKIRSDTRAIRMTEHIHFNDNEVHSGGRVFHGAVAVLANFIRHGRFFHNHISDFYYNGIVCGGSRRTVGCYDNQLMYNHIHDIGHGWLSDMGGIYVHGLQPGMFIRGNRIYDINSACYGSNCVYLDDNAEHIVVEKNLLYNTNTNIINMKGRENIIRHNILAFGDDALIRRASPHVADSMVATVFKNVFIVNNTSVHRTRNEIPLFSPGYFSDLNVIWNIGNKPIQVERPYNYNQPSHIAGIAEWQEKTGNDLNSVFEDPGLKDPTAFDFEILPGSILHKLQIEPGNFNNVGPRPKELWDFNVGRTDRGATGEGHVE